MDGLVRIGMEGFSKEEDSLFFTAEGAIHHRSLDLCPRFGPRKFPRQRSQILF